MMEQSYSLHGGGGGSGGRERGEEEQGGKPVLIFLSMTHLW